MPLRCHRRQGRSEHRWHANWRRCRSGHRRHALALQHGTLDPQKATQAIDFIRTFADKCHHAKEEDVLFVRMESVGFPHDNGPIAVMLHDHDSGRAFVRAMADVVQDAARGDADALRIFANNAHGYTEMLREHIQKEDKVLYPMADQSFDKGDQAELLAAFERADKQAGAGIHERYAELASFESMFRKGTQ